MNCILCGHRVGQGNRHAKFACPPKPTRRKALLRAKAKRRAKKAGEWIPKRGEAIAGTGVPKTASKG